ncbi:MAG TPA: hypothetical protein VK175_05555 [Leadbetterella sp.]|nr:hypothetical protein [Leadbetterella sp.]
MTALQLFSIITFFGGVIVSAFVFIGKKYVDFFKDKELEKFKNRIFYENENSKRQFEKELEGYRSQLSILEGRQTRINDKISLVIEELYSKLIEYNSSMIDLTQTLRLVDSSDRNNLRQEELERIKNSTDLGNDYMIYYHKNKLYFNKETRILIENLNEELKNAFWDYTFKERFAINDSAYTNDILKKVSEIIRNKVPILVENLEKSFRRNLGLEE